MSSCYDLSCSYCDLIKRSTKEKLFIEKFSVDNILMRCSAEKDFKYAQEMECKRTMLVAQLYGSSSNLNQHSQGV